MFPIRCSVFRVSCLRFGFSFRVPDLFFRFPRFVFAIWCFVPCSQFADPFPAFCVCDLVFAIWSFVFRDSRLKPAVVPMWRAEFRGSRMEVGADLEK